MKIETKFGVGDSAWIIRDEMFKRLILCVTCAHTGKITIQGEQFDCPKCNGKAREPQFAGRKWFVDRSMSIGWVEATVRTPEAAERYGDEPLEIRYCDGPNGGGVYKERDLWPSREAAEAECDRRNTNVCWRDDDLEAAQLAARPKP